MKTFMIQKETITTITKIEIFSIEQESIYYNDAFNELKKDEDKYLLEANIEEPIIASSYSLLDTETN